MLIPGISLGVGFGIGVMIFLLAFALIAGIFIVIVGGLQNRHLI